MDNIDKDVTQKVLGVFAELVGDRARRLDPHVVATPAMDAICGAMAEDYEIDMASAIAFHMADWNWDAALIVALHLYPERFTGPEIAEGVRRFLTHAPNHIRAACKLTGYYVWDDVSGDDATDGIPEE
jgi:hypothetical protein